MTAPHSPVHIVTDSTADLVDEWIGELPVSVVPLTVDIDGAIFKDGVDLSKADFVTHLRRGVFPKTSQPSIGAFQEIYQSILDTNHDIVSIHISPQLSGTFNSATQAKSALGTDAVHVVDSTTVSMGIGFLVLEAARMARDGMSADEIAAFIEDRKQDQRLYATLETLEYLRKGGRIGRASAMLGSALQLKPVIQVRNGSVEPVERVRTYRRALERLATIYEEQQPFERVAVLHLDAQREADRLADRIRETQPEVEIVTGEIGTVIGAYGGPGLAGFTGLVSRK